jgi:hypothetical protein
VVVPVTLVEEPVITPPTTLAAVVVPVTLVEEPVITPPTTLAPLMAPVALTRPVVRILLACTLPVALTRPPVKILDPVTLPLELITPEFNEVNVPTDVIFDCALVVTVPAVVAYVALATAPVTLAPVNDVNLLPLPIILPPVMLPVVLNRVDTATWYVVPPSTMGNTSEVLPTADNTGN